MSIGYRNHHRSTGNTGNLLETDLLYKPNDPRIRALEAIDHTKVQYKRLAQAVLDCIHNNPNGYHGNEVWDPPAKWMSDVHYGIVSALKLTDWRRVSIIPALKSSADIHHGIDFIVIYDDKERQQSAIVTVDLSLRQKDSFKADVLVTDTGATPNQEYYDIPAVHIADLEYGSRDEDRESAAFRRAEIGRVIAEMIQEKLQHTDPHYTNLMRNVGTKIRKGIAHVMNEAA